MSLHTLRQETARSRDSDVGPVSVPMGPSTPIKEGDEWMRLLGSLKALNAGLEDLNVSRLRKGYRPECVRVLRMLAFEVSMELAYKMAKSGLSFKSQDAHVVQKVFDFLRMQSCYVPKISVEQFLIKGYLLDKFKIMRHFAEEVYYYADKGERVSGKTTNLGSEEFDGLKVESLVSLDGSASARLRLATAARKWGMDLSSISPSVPSPCLSQRRGVSLGVGVGDPILDVATAHVQIPVEVPPPVSPIVYKHHHSIAASEKKLMTPLSSPDAQRLRGRARSRSNSGTMATSEADNDESSSSAIRSRLASKDAQDIIREDIHQQLQELSKSSDCVCSPITHVANTDHHDEHSTTESASRICPKSPPSPSSSSRAHHGNGFPDYLNVYLDTVEPPSHRSKSIVRPGVGNERDNVFHTGPSLPRVSSLSTAGEDWNSRGATLGDEDEGDDDISGLESSHISCKSLHYIDENALKTISKIKVLSNHFLENSSLLHKYDLPGRRVPGTGVDLKAWPWQLEKDIAYERVTGVRVRRPRSPSAATRHTPSGSLDRSRSLESHEEWLDAVESKKLPSKWATARLSDKRTAAESGSPDKVKKTSNVNVEPAPSFSPAKYYSTSPPATSVSLSPGAEVYSGAAHRQPDESAEAELWSAQGRFDDIHTAYIAALKERNEYMQTRWNRLNAKLTNTKV